MNRADGSVFNSDGLQMAIDYGARTDGQPDYLGYTAMGQTDDDKKWQIAKFTYITIGSSDSVATKKLAIGAWSNRASLTYA